MSKGLGWDRRTYSGDMERFLPTRGEQRIERFLPIDPFPSPSWRIDIIDDCCSSFMSGESGLQIVSKGSGWGRRTYSGDAERFLLMRGTQWAERFLSSLMIVLDLARSWLYACEYLNNKKCIYLLHCHHDL